MNPFITVVLTALIPLVVGSLWYSPMLFAKPWMAAVGISADQRPSGGMMARNMLVLYFLSLLVAFGLQMMVIHQYHLPGILMHEPGFREKTGPAYEMYTNFMTHYGRNFRSYRHGAFVGAITAI